MATQDQTVPHSWLVPESSTQFNSIQFNSEPGALMQVTFDVGILGRISVLFWSMVDAFGAAALQSKY